MSQSLPGLLAHPAPSVLAHDKGMPTLQQSHQHFNHLIACCAQTIVAVVSSHIYSIAEARVLS